jgi:multidrug efflux system membrane fusion protein
VSEPQALALRKSTAAAGTKIDLAHLTSIPVEIGLQDEDGYPHKGHLDYSSPQLDSASGTLAMRGIFENKDQVLLPGLFARVRIPIAQENKALLTRDDAIGTSQEGSYVMVVGADNVVARKIVKTGQRQGPLRIIESGLDPGDWVVIEGVQHAFPGAKVETQQSELTSDAANPSVGPRTSAPASTTK